MDNIEAEIYQMLNELTKRHGLRPIDFSAEFQEYEPRMCHILRFEYPLGANEPFLRKYRGLLTSLGLNADECEGLIGDIDKIYAALEHALEVAPAKPTSGRRL